MRATPSYEAAAAVFACLRPLGLAANSRAYNGLLGAAGRCGRWREAQALYLELLSEGLPASLDTHTALIQVGGSRGGEQVAELGPAATPRAPPHELARPRG
jgi:pentatricopeptide repeat protein